MSAIAASTAASFEAATAAVEAPVAAPVAAPATSWPVADLEGLIAASNKPGTLPSTARPSRATVEEDVAAGRVPTHFARPISECVVKWGIKALVCTLSDPDFWEFFCQRFFVRERTLIAKGHNGAPNYAVGGMGHLIDWWLEMGSGTPHVWAHIPETARDELQELGRLESFSSGGYPDHSQLLRCWTSYVEGPAAKVSLTNFALVYNGDWASYQAALDEIETLRQAIYRLRDNACPFAGAHYSLSKEERGAAWRDRQLHESGCSCCQTYLEALKGLDTAVAAGPAAMAAAVSKVRETFKAPAAVEAPDAVEAPAAEAAEDTHCWCRRHPGDNLHVLPCL